MEELEKAFNRLLEKIEERFMESMMSVEAFVTARSAVDIFSTEILDVSCILTSSGKFPARTGVPPWPGQDGIPPGKGPGASHWSTPLRGGQSENITSRRTTYAGGNDI